MTSAARPQETPFVTADGRPAQASRVIKTPLTRAYSALRSACADDAELAQLLIDEDPEIDMEAAGRVAGSTDRVLLDQDGQLL